MSGLVHDARCVWQGTSVVHRRGRSGRWAGVHALPAVPGLGTGIGQGHSGCVVGVHVVRVQGSGLGYNSGLVSTTTCK